MLIGSETSLIFSSANIILACLRNGKTGMPGLSTLTHLLFHHHINGLFGTDFSADATPLAVVIVNFNLTFISIPGYSQVRTEQLTKPATITFIVV
jgi:hypothetical protein